MDYLDKLRANIKQLEEQIEVLNEKIFDATFERTPHDLLTLLLNINQHKTRLIHKQSHLINCLSSTLAAESKRLDRMYEVTK